MLAATSTTTNNRSSTTTQSYPFYQQQQQPYNMGYHHHHHPANPSHAATNNLPYPTIAAHLPYQPLPEQQQKQPVMSELKDLSVSDLEELNRDPRALRAFLKTLSNPDMESLDSRVTQVRTHWKNYEVLKNMTSKIFKIELANLNHFFPYTMARRDLSLEAQI